VPYVWIRNQQQFIEVLKMTPQEQKREQREQQERKDREQND
jgi:hypothetical protein